MKDTLKKEEAHDYEEDKMTLGEMQDISLSNNNTLKERVEEIAKTISTSVRYCCGKGQYEENTPEQKAYLDGVETAIGMMYIDLTGTSEISLTSLIQQAKKEEREEIVEMIKDIEKGGLGDEKEDLIRENTILEIINQLSNTK